MFKIWFIIILFINSYMYTMEEILEIPEGDFKAITRYKNQKEAQQDDECRQFIQNLCDEAMTNAYQKIKNDPNLMNYANGKLSKKPKYPYKRPEDFQKSDGYIDYQAYQEYWNNYLKEIEENTNPIYALLIDKNGKNQLSGIAENLCSQGLKYIVRYGWKEYLKYCFDIGSPNIRQRRFGIIRHEEQESYVWKS